MDTNLVQSLINMMECQLEEAFVAVGGGGGVGGRRPSASNGKPSGLDGSTGGGVGIEPAMDPKVRHKQRHIQFKLMTRICYEFLV